MEKRSTKKRGLQTRIIHAGSGGKKDPYGPHVIPIHQTSTFRFESVEQIEALLKENLRHDMYSRLSNLIHRVLEEQLMELENGEAAQVFGCGMGAIVTTLFTLTKAFDEVIAHRNVYGGTYKDLNNFSNRFLVKTKFVDARDVKNVLEQVTDKTVMVWLETPSNPNLDICDFEEIKKELVAMGRPDILVVVDNTFATPYNQQPLMYGTDIVIHSLTKYLNGFGDFLGGAIVTSKEIMDRIWEVYTGFACMDPGVAWQIARNIKTFTQRMESHNNNAAYIAHCLSYNPKVKKVYFPGLPDHPNHTVAMRLMRTSCGNPAFGGMVSFELKDSETKTRKFLNEISGGKMGKEALVSLSVSLGTLDTLVCWPSIMTHGAIEREERLGVMGIPDGLIRLSVGLEDLDDIVEALERGFEVI